MDSLNFDMSTILDFHTHQLHRKSTHSHQKNIYYQSPKSKQIHRKMSAHGLFVLNVTFIVIKPTNTQNKCYNRQHFFADIDEILRLCYMLHVDSFLFLTVDLRAFAKQKINEIIQHIFFVFLFSWAWFANLSLVSFLHIFVVGVRDLVWRRQKKLFSLIWVFIVVIIWIGSSITVMWNEILFG